VDYSPDGRLVATVCGEESVRLWQASTGKERLRIPVAAVSLAFSPDGKTVATTGFSGDNAIHFWDATTGQERRTLRATEPGYFPTGITFSSDGKVLATIYWVKNAPKKGRRRPPIVARISVWRVDTGKEVDGFKAPEAGALAVALAPDGKALAVGHRTGIYLYDAGTGRKSRALRRHNASSVVLAFSSAGTLASASGDETVVRLWDAGTGREKHVLRGHKEPVSSLAFSRDGKRLVSGWGRLAGAFRVWDIASGKPILTHHSLFGLQSGSLALSPGGKTVADGGTRLRHKPSFWDVATGKEIVHERGHEFTVGLVGFAPGGKVVTAGARIRIWDQATSKQVALLQSDDMAWTVALSGDGRTAAANLMNGTIQVWDVTTGKRKTRFRTGRNAPHLRPALSLDGKTLAADRALWDVTTGKRLRKMQGDCLGPFTLSPDGKTLATVRGRIELWDTATGRALPGFDHKRHDSSPGREVCFSPDSSLIAVPDFPDCFTVWELATRRFVGRCTSKGWVTSVTFSPDGRLLACGKDDGSVELWEVLTWTVVGRRQWRTEVGDSGDVPFREGVSSVAFAADGKTLASAHPDTTVLLWDVPAFWLPAGPTAPLTAPQLNALWTQLGNEKAAEALQAVGALSQAPKQSVALLHKQVRPTPPVAKRLAKWLAELDSDDFAVREKASEEIGRLGRVAAPALREALKGRPSPEVRRQVERALARIDQRRHTREELRDLRAVLVLEQIGSAEARALLRRLAAGAAEAPLTQEAKAALRRLER
jgi:WD40 repeat protein